MDKERVAGAMFLMIGIYGLVFSTQLPLGNPEEPGPAGFPLCISILLCLSGLSKLLYRRGKEAKRDDEETIQWGIMMKKLMTPMKILGITLAFILTMEWVGYLLTSSAYMFLLFLWVSRFRVWVAMSLAILIGSGSWFFFGKILAVSLPEGFLSL